MLNREKIIKEIENISDKIFASNSDQIKLALEKWKEIAQTFEFKKRVDESKSSFLLPDWQQNLSHTVQVGPKIENYAILASDGSQIYPERHMSGINCILINTGHCLLEYSQKSRVTLSSEPHIFAIDQILPDEQESFSVDIIDLKREDLELKSALEQATKLAAEYKKNNTHFAVFFDGSLIFWQLESKIPEIKKFFLNEYIQTLDGFYNLNIPMASYISMPKSRELINLTKIGFCRFELANCIACHAAFQNFPCKAVDHISDAQLCHNLLNEYQRTIVFQSKSKITNDYPMHLKPCFLYLNVGKEIVRIEFPFWISQNTDHLDLICKIAIDQAKKGNGYPVALAEAHEQAVIKSTDRDFFYHIICKKSIDLKGKITFSQKSIKKHNSVF